MKIVCESCGAKYSIADERVSGKMFKIRCKRCSEVIVVRGDQQPVAEAAPALASTQDPTWHVVVDGEQAGPYTPQQLEEMLARGAIDWDAYVWTEGFDNWVAMREVEAIVSQLGGPKPHSAPASADSAGAFRARPGGDTLVGQPSMGADPFADDSGTGDPFAVPSRSTPAPDLFARGGAAHQPAAANYRDGDQAVMVAAAPSPRVSAERAMTGARNENSVLFSLKNLQALATGSGSGSPPAATAIDRGGYASGEGSGLIDIRALATATGVNEPGHAPAQRDDLLSMGSQGGAFGNLGSPMLAPAAEEGESNRRTIVWGAVASVALLSLTAVVIVYMVRSPSEPVAPRLALEPASSAPAEPSAAVAPAPAAAAATQTATGDGQPGATAAEEPEKSPASAAERERLAEHARKRAHEAALKEASSAKSAPVAESKTLPAAVAAPAKSRPKAGPATLDELLDGALSGPAPKTRPAEAAEPAANLPDTPTRDQVLSAMTGVKPAVIACAKGGGAVATVTVNVAGMTGRVTTAQVTGVTGPEGSCIAQAVRKAAFPKFQQKVFKVTFPYKL
jgi:predicted Zn finger-like uncharacterized protein